VNFDENVQGIPLSNLLCIRLLKSPYSVVGSILQLAMRKQRILKTEELGLLTF